jgi:AcrR family transcriptional regulator
MVASSFQGLEMQTQAIKRQAKYEKRQSSILRAASEVIARDGFEGASMRAMAARGRLGLSGIYYYYKNKDELLYAIQHHAFSNLVESLKERLGVLKTPEQKLRAIIENHFQFFVENTNEFRVCVHEINSLSGKYYKNILAVRQEYFRLVRDVISEVLRRSQYEIDMATFFLFGSLNWVYMWYDPVKNSDIQRVTTQFLKVILNGINGSKA